MNRRNIVILALAILTGTLGVPRADAQTIQTYRCADGTQFIVAFYEYDKRAFMQIDGKAVPLAKRLTLSGARYSGAGITLKIGKAGTSVKHLKRPVTACEVD